MVELNEAYIVLSTKTGRPYLDEANTSYLFTSKKEADAFVENHENTFIESRYYNLLNLKSQCYAAGAMGIHICVGTHDDFFPLIEKEVERNYYNNTLNRVLFHIKNERRSSRLRPLLNERFLVPCKIQSKNGYPEILYGTVIREDDFLYIAFSDLEEFEVWRTHVEGWDVIEISYNALWRIARHHGVLINPYGNYFKLSRKIMEKIRVFAEKGGLDDTK